MAISDQQYAQRWDHIFSRDIKDGNSLAGNTDSQESEQRIHELEDPEGKRDGER
jgi:hypothetical protein